MQNQATLKDIMAFFGMKPGEFKIEWSKLTDQDRRDIRSGLTDGTLTY